MASMQIIRGGDLWRQREISVAKTSTNQ